MMFNIIGLKYDNFKSRAGVLAAIQICENDLDSLYKEKEEKNKSMIVHQTDSEMLDYFHGELERISNIIKEKVSMQDKFKMLINIDDGRNVKDLKINLKEINSRLRTFNEIQTNLRSAPFNPTYWSKQR